MFRAILTTALALTVIGACLLGLSQIALAVQGRAISTVEWVVAGLVLLGVIIVALLRKKKHARRKYKDMQDSALW